MRNIEKGLLLAEMFSSNTDSHIGPFIEWIKSTPQYKLFLERKEELSKKNSRSARRIYSYYRQIDLKDIRSIKDGVIVYGKLNYLLKISDPSCYTNPLIIAYIENDEMTLGDIKVELDNKLITLNELSTMKGFSLQVKEEIIRKKLASWEYELDTQVIDPIREIEQRKQYIPERHIFTRFRVFELIYVVVMMIVGLLIFLIGYPGIYEITHLTGNKIASFIYYSFDLFSLIYALTVLVVYIIKIKDYKFYIDSRKTVLNEIKKEEISAVNKLENYLIEKVAAMETLDAKISEFNTISKYYDLIDYFQVHLIKKATIKKDENSMLEYGLLGIHFLLLIGLVIVLIMIIGGAI